MTRPDGYVFKAYYKKPSGKTHEQWLSPAAYHRERISSTFTSARNRSREKGLPFDISVDYLLSIFPTDGLCPALRTPLVWGGARHNSPSLDRKRPDLGYVQGNVVFISDKANRIKTDATNEEVLAVAHYLTRIPN